MFRWFSLYFVPGTDLGVFTQACLGPWWLSRYLLFTSEATEA